MLCFLDVGFLVKVEELAESGPQVSEAGYARGEGAEDPALPGDWVAVKELSLNDHSLDIC